MSDRVRPYTSELHALHLVNETRDYSELTYMDLMAWRRELNLFIESGLTINNLTFPSLASLENTLEALEAEIVYWHELLGSIRIERESK